MKNGVKQFLLTGLLSFTLGTTSLAVVTAPMTPQQNAQIWIAPACWSDSRGFEDCCAAKCTALYEFDNEKYGQCYNTCMATLVYRDINGHWPPAP